MATLKNKAPVVLFGYDSSAFTQKIRLILQLKQISYTYVVVPSMLPRPVLGNHFNITHRKIPVLMLGREVYIDTSIQTTALQHHFDHAPTHPSIHPPQTSPTLARLLTSTFTDQPVYRAVCGLMPSSVWRSQFGRDRASLIGHPLDPAKLDNKIPEMMSKLDLWMSMLESLLAERGQGAAAGDFVLGTDAPGMLDVTMFFILRWGRETALGKGVNDLTAGEVPDGGEPGCEELFARYPLLSAWFDSMVAYFDALPLTERRIEKVDQRGIQGVVDEIAQAQMQEEIPMLPTPAGRNLELDEKRGLILGKKVSIAPSDTGMNHPTVGTLVGSSAEELVIMPDRIDGGGKTTVDVRMHFPRIEFRIKPLQGSSGSKL